MTTTIGSISKYPGQSQLPLVPSARLAHLGLAVIAYGAGTAWYKSDTVEEGVSKALKAGFVHVEARPSPLTRVDLAQTDISTAQRSTQSALISSSC